MLGGILAGRDLSAVACADPIWLHLAVVGDRAPGGRSSDPVWTGSVSAAPPKPVPSPAAALQPPGQGDAAPGGGAVRPWESGVVGAGRGGCRRARSCVAPGIRCCGCSVSGSWKTRCRVPPGNPVAAGSEWGDDWTNRCGVPQKHEQVRRASRNPELRLLGRCGSGELILFRLNVVDRSRHPRASVVRSGHRTRGRGSAEAQSPARQDPCERQAVPGHGNRSSPGSRYFRSASRPSRAVARASALAGPNHVVRIRSLFP